jgi:hypothetical protein
MHLRTAGIIFCKTDLWLNQLNVGILAGIRPCGIIVMLTELFTSESKTQVYGALHSYVTACPKHAKNIGKY